MSAPAPLKNFVRTTILCAPPKESCSTIEGEADIGQPSPRRLQFTSAPPGYSASAATCMRTMRSGSRGGSPRLSLSTSPMPTRTRNDTTVAQPIPRPASEVRCGAWPEAGAARIRVAWQRGRPKSDKCPQNYFADNAFCAASRFAFAVSLAGLSAKAARKSATASSYIFLR